jgi:23S rRNA (uracil-5-)-methyltransferase RumA
MGRRKKKQKKERFVFSEEQRSARPRCQHFGHCGGCRYQDVPYPLQVEGKAGWLSRLFDREVRVEPSPVAYGYRNRMDFVFAFGKLGLRERGHHRWVVEILHCDLVDEKANRLLAAVREQLNRHEIPPYNYLKHEGYLRYAVLRTTAAGQTLVNFVTASEEPIIHPVVHEIAKEADAVVWSIQDGLADTSYGRIHQTYGRPVIVEKIGDKEFQLGANTFFQNNPYLIPKVLEDIGQWVEGQTLDLYCGIGLIGISVADKAERILGVESVEDSIELARGNARINHVESIEFLSGEVRPYLIEKYREEPRDFPWRTVIVDPPREGLTPRTVKYLKRLAPPRIIYLSCNPSVLKEEIELFEEIYDLKMLKGYDLFPQTPHAEVLAVFEKKD